MSGLQEILVLAIIVLAIIFIPRMRVGQQATSQKMAPLSQRMPGKIRLAVAASIIYPALVAAVLQPWKGAPIRFFYIGIGPVALLWLLYWVIGGFNKNKS